MLTDRIIGALTFKTGVYAEVEQDTTFTSTAWIIVVVDILIDDPLRWLLSSLVGTVFATIAFFIGAVIIGFAGRTLFKAEVTTDELVRTIGLASVWRAVGVIAILGGIAPVLACVISPAAVVAWVLGIIAWFVAAKEALDLEWVQTIVTVIVGVIGFVVVQGVANVVLRLIGLSAAAIGGLF
jgi:hypothetical protein